MNFRNNDHYFTFRVINPLVWEIVLRNNEPSGNTNLSGKRVSPGWYPSQGNYKHDIIRWWHRVKVKLSQNETAKNVLKRTEMHTRFHISRNGRWEYNVSISPYTLHSVFQKGQEVKGGWPFLRDFQPSKINTATFNIPEGSRFLIYYIIISW